VFFELTIHPVVIAALIGGGCAVARCAGVDIHAQSMWVAAGIALMAAEVAMIPLLLSRGADQSAASQAGLFATVIHLMLSIGLAGVVSFKLLPGQPFLYWMCGFYWVTLIGVAAMAVRSVRHAPLTSAAKRPSAV
jgi:hypothetical protein